MSSCLDAAPSRPPSALGQDREIPANLSMGWPFAQQDEMFNSDTCSAMLEFQ